MDNGLSLMAVTLTPKRDWMQDAQNALISAGMGVKANNRHLLFWKSVQKYRGVQYTNGWALRRIWLAPGQVALGVLAKRYYFARGSEEIDIRPEWQILEGARPPARPVVDELAVQRSIVLTLADQLGSGFDPVNLELVDGNLATARTIRIKGGEYNSPPYTLNELYRQNGFDEIVPDFSVIVCPLSGVSSETIHSFVTGVNECCSARNVPVRTQVVQVERIERRIKELALTGELVKSARCVLFILPDKNTPLDESGANLFALLETHGVPFRRAYANDPLEFSIPDQLPSLILAAGGQPHRVESRIRGEPIWTVGVDLGHRPDQEVSIIVMTLVDPDGKFVNAWSVEQSRDETAKDENISLLLRECRKALFKLEQRPRVLVLRDGRLFENETSGLYSSLLTENLSLVELRKRGNPQIYFERPASPNDSRQIAARVADCNTVFAVTAPPRNDRTLPKIMKITWREQWNKLSLSHLEISRLIAGSAAAPGLGLQPRHLPAAIYWADGIAGANDVDLRFRGIRVDRIRKDPPC